MNSGINPIVYAITIPPFGQFIKRLVRCNPSSCEVQTIEHELHDLKDIAEEGNENTETRL